MTEHASDDPHAQVRGALASARRQLLDLTFRNHFLNYRILRARGVVVAGDDASRVARLLLDDDVPLSFVTREAAERRRAMRLEAEAKARTETQAETQAETHAEARAEPEPDPPLRYAIDDRVLVAAHDGEELARRLDATRKTARTFVEERGVNTLFVALGTLHWSEAGHGASERVAPLFMVPVTLELASVAHGARVRYDGEDPQGNPTLRERLRHDGIDLPLPDDDVRLAAYLDRVERAVAGRTGWRVDRSHVSLGFFSFTRYLMYLDLDESRWPDPSRVLEHPVVGAALTRGFAPEPPVLDPAQRLDDQPPYQGLHGVLEADASQSEAIVEALERTALVIQGPPGTGKSQTIANVLAEALARGQRVLFVAEKKAALDVVKRRLDAVGLGDAALELHSYKATRAAVVADLRRTMELGQPRVDDGATARERLQRARAALNDYVDALHEPIGATLTTPYQLIGRASAPDAVEGAERERFDLAAAGIEPSVDRTPADLERLQALARSIEAWSADEGEPSEHPFRYARVETASPAHARRVEEAVSDAIAALVAVEAALDPLAGAPFDGAPASLAAARARVAATRALLSLLGAGVRVDLGAPTWRQGREALAAAAEAARDAAAVRARAGATIDPAAWGDPDLDVATVDALRVDLTARDGPLYHWFSPRHRRALARIRRWMRSTAPRSRADVVAALEVLDEHARAAARFEEHAGRWRGALPSHGSLLDAGAVAEGVATFVAAVGRGGGHLHPDGATALATTDAANLEAALSRIDVRTAEARERLAALASLLDLDLGAAFDGAREVGEAPLDAFHALLKTWRREPRRIAAGARWRRLRREAEETGALPLWDALTSGAVRTVALERRLTRALDDALLEHAVASRPPLAHFESRTHEAALAEFRDLDAEQLAQHRALVSSLHFAGLPAMSGHGEVGVLLQEFNKRRRHRPVRRLMEEAGNAVQAIKPIFLMSPLSVATFLPAGGLRFDLVVFDEASQVRPADALGALLRADRAVVVGDDRQLPPTTFFDALIDEAHPDDEDAMIGDVESVLGLLGARGAPQAWLAWHYRSRHESLIAVSNREFYDDRLMLFPSPDVARDDAGVTLHHLPDAVYDRGRTRTNAVEARAVAEAVRSHAHRRPERTLGVATFAMPQADAIEREVERLAADDAVLRAFLQAHPLEPFFVKPLEAVQGDERDEIVLSVGYGRDADGRLTYQFGPLNQAGGERRLNVLITRARWRTHLYSNVTDEDLDPERCTASGLRALRTYLAFARTGAFEPQEVAAAGGAMRLEDAVATALRERGYLVHRRVGQPGSCIELALADPERPGRMLLAVEFDGEAYHAIRTARDRDRLRPGVLAGLGWHVHRMWSSDWWRDPEACLARVEAAFADTLRDAHERDAGSSAAPAGTSPRGVERDDSRLWNDATLRFPPYTVATLGPIPFDGATLSRAPTQDVAAWLARVVAIEGPVHVDDAFRRVIDASGATRIGSRIRERLEHGVAAGVRTGQFGRVGDALVPNDLDARPFQPRDRSALEGRDRDFGRVPTFELDAAIEAVVRASHGIAGDDVASAVARLLGFARTTDDVQEAIAARVAHLLDDGALELGARGEVRVRRGVDAPR